MGERVNKIRFVGSINKEKLGLEVSNVSDFEKERKRTRVRRREERSAAICFYPGKGETHNSVMLIGIILRNN